MNHRLNLPRTLTGNAARDTRRRLPDFRDVKLIHFQRGRSRSKYWVFRDRQKIYRGRLAPVGHEVVDFDSNLQQDQLSNGHSFVRTKIYK